MSDPRAEKIFRREEIKARWRARKQETRPTPPRRTKPRKVAKPKRKTREVTLPDWAQFLFEPARYKIAHGGRGGSKSWSFARALVIMGARRRIRVLCAREFQVSIKQSVHALLKSQIEALGLGARYEVGQTTIQGTNGTEFFFVGLATHIDSVKSMEGIDVVWIEEAHTVSEDSWAILIPTVRKAGSEIWVSFNPDAADDPTYVRFVTQAPPGAVVKKVGWQDNPWFGEELRREKDWLYKVDPEAAAHVWGGMVRAHAVAQILRGRWRVEPFDPGTEAEGWHGPYFGADWGFAADPMALVKIWIWQRPLARREDPATKRERILYVEHEAWGLGVDVVDLPKKWDEVPGAKSRAVKADNARPDLISHVRQNGYANAEPCSKWPGSVEAGIDHLRSYDAIVIHTRCTHAAEEAKLWSFKVDKLTGKILPEQVDAHNHVMDSIRYALEDHVRSRLTGGIVIDPSIGSQENPWRI